MSCVWLESVRVASGCGSPVCGDVQLQAHSMIQTMVQTILVSLFTHAARHTISPSRIQADRDHACAASIVLRPLTLTSTLTQSTSYTRTTDSVPPPPPSGAAAAVRVGATDRIGRVRHPAAGRIGVRSTEGQSARRAQLAAGCSATDNFSSLHTPCDASNSVSLALAVDTVVCTRATNERLRP